MAFELAIELGTSVLSLKPGSSATLDAGITNTGTLVQHYQVELLGLPGPGMTGRPNEPLKLLPKESGRVPVTVTLPADSPSPRVSTGSACWCAPRSRRTSRGRPG